MQILHHMRKVSEGIRKDHEKLEEKVNSEKTDYNSNKTNLVNYKGSYLIKGNNKKKFYKP